MSKSGPIDLLITTESLQQIRRARRVISPVINPFHLFQIEANNLDSSLFQLFENFWYQPFPFFRIVFETFAIEANSSSHFRAIVRFRIAINSKLDTNSNHNRTTIRARAEIEPTQAANFFDFEFDLISNFSISNSISNCNQLKLGHKFEPQVELELKSNLNSSSSYCFCSRSARARRWPLLKNNKRRPLWEPLDMYIITCFHLGGGPFFWSDFWKGFFLKNGVKWSPKCPQKGHEIY